MKKKPKEQNDKVTVESLFVKDYVAHKIKPTPFGLLGEKGRQAVMGQFEALLNTIDTPILIYINPEWERVVVDGEPFRFMDLNYYIIIHKDKANVVDAFFKTIVSYRDEGIVKNVFSQRPIVVEEFPKYVKVKKIKTVKQPDGTVKKKVLNLYGKAYILTKLGTTLPGGVMLDIVKFVEDAMMYIEPIDDTTALAYADKARIRLQSLLTEKASLTIQARAQRLELLAARIMAGIKLHRFSFVFTITAKDLDELKLREERYVKRLKKYLLEFDSPSFVQGELFKYNFKTKVFGIPVEVIKKITIDSHSLRLFYPFISDNIIDPDGIFLGINPDTNQPIVYNPYQQTNYNIVILGETGSGKSMTTKVILRRLLQKMPDAHLYIIDPEAEYAKAAVLIAPDAKIIKVKPGEPLGLDPFRMFVDGDLEITELGSILSDIYNIPDEMWPNLISDLQDAKEKGIDNIFDFVDYILSKEEYKNNEDIKAYYLSRLKKILVPPDRYIFSGKPQKIENRTIFDLKAVEDHKLKVLITTLISAVLVKRLMVELPENVRKIMVVDEAWLFVNFPSTMYMFQTISRRGRKRAIIFMFITQKPDDVVRNEVGRTILEQSYTAILLAQREKGAQVLKELYNLTDDEKEYLTEVTPGHGILRLGDIKTKLYVKVTKREMSVFSTKVVGQEREEEE